ncbi:MAG TPA: guanylate cyclase [Porticoccaceae bacterium]|jgi:hypothetical protein|nr:guanylate cyclase [Porticoccaceae bacterium]
MKGMLFTALLELIEAEFGSDVLDDVLDDVKPASGGIYTSVGTYDHTELVAMLVSLSKQTNVSLTNLTKTFGMYHFAEFTAAYPYLFEGLNSSFELLEKIDWFIHAEVRKLYPGATPPKFECTRLSSTSIELIYKSPRCLGDVAEGLIYGCASHYGEKILVRRERLGDMTGSTERFLLTLLGK